ncbi:MAG: YceH family protein [Acidobacteriota bacterium]
MLSVRRLTMRLPRELDPVEIRVLGCLLEKELTTPDAYPLTLKALVAACNQKSSRSPVMQLSEADVRAVLDRLHQEVLVWPVSGARSERWRHALKRQWALDGPTHAVMCLLLLRGPQTVGALRNRAERLHSFADNNEVESTLDALRQGDEPLTVLLGRRSGQNEARWMHLAGGTPDEATLASVDPEPRQSSLAQRVTDLEERLARLEATLASSEGEEGNRG